MKPDPRAAIAAALACAQNERALAVRSAELAERHERLFAQQGPLGDLHETMAMLQRRVQLRHLAAAAMHEAFAARAELWMSFGEGSRPLLFMPAVADTTKSDGAVLTMYDTNRIETLIATSGSVARAAQEWEFTFGEGPSYDALTAGTPVFASTGAMTSRWPHYGRAIADLGVRTVAAVPLDISMPASFATLTVFDPWLGGRSAVLPLLSTVADALTQSFLLSDDPAGVRPLFQEADHRPTVFQAAGKVMGARGCGLPDALALMRARAFAVGRPLIDIADDLIDGTLTLDDVG